MIYLLVTSSAILAAASVWFLVRPLARGAHMDSREQYYQLLTVRDRLFGQLNELDLDEGDRSMAADTAADERARLEGELATVLAKLESLGEAAGDMVKEERSGSTKTWRVAVVGLAVIVPALATGLYLINVTVAPAELQGASSLPAGVPPQALKMVERLEKRMQENPDDLDGWLKLGRSYNVLNRLDDALTAYDNAYRLLPKNYKPETPEALWFLGLSAYRHGDVKFALAYWERLLGELAPDSEDAGHLRMVIAKAHERLGHMQSPQKSQR